MTNSSQGVTASLTLSAFGQTVASSGSSTSAYQFGATSGYRNDGDAGLTLVGCRFYDAQAGRFITRDTYLDQKPYAYCDGDPVNATDPSGHGPVLRLLSKMFQAMEAEPELSAGGLAGGSVVGVVGAASCVDYDLNPSPGVLHNSIGAATGGVTALAGVGLVEAGAGFAAGAGGAVLVGGAIVVTGGTIIAVIGVVTLGVGIYRACQ